jgi:MFS family permease
MAARLLHARNFRAVTLADFLVRTAYQMGKTPLLPIFAATLGASDLLLGMIVSVSTLTGLALKPLIGLLSDRWGRRAWLLAGTAFFAFMPFAYSFIATPAQLFGVRIVHGLATAIYGPVTLAYVAEQSGVRRAEGLGWFGIARSGGYIVGPALAGWLLLWLPPEQVFTVSGFLACAAFVPVFVLGESTRTTNGRLPLRQAKVRRQLQMFNSNASTALTAAAKTPALWLAGALELIAFMGLYAAKAFLPLYALDNQVNVAVIGSFFALQEAVHVLGKPVAGRWADGVGYRRIIGGGMMLMAMTLALLSSGPSALALLALAVPLGTAQALIFPATAALLAVQAPPAHLGTAMGLLGSMQNGGKVAGPLAAGTLLLFMDYRAMFLCMSLILLLGALYLLARELRRPARKPQIGGSHH